MIYTDYHPRLAGSRYYGGDLPHSYIAICPYPDDSERMMYRDRRYIFSGVAVPEDFYHPDYSNRQLDEQPKDYRRTLYWNPDLQLDGEGKARVSFWNNSHTMQMSVTAEGVTGTGRVLTNNGRTE